MFFHAYSEVLRNQSFVIYDGADSEGPRNVPVKATFETRTFLERRCVALVCKDLWKGGVGWVLRPALRSDVNIDASISIRVWVSSSDQITGVADGSGYLIGTAEIDSSSRIITAWSSDLEQKIGGNIFPDSPSAFEKTIKISSHKFDKNNKLLFFLVAGSTKQGWKVNVHFDSQAWPSGAAIPSDIIERMELPSQPPSQQPFQPPIH